MACSDCKHSTKTDRGLECRWGPPSVISYETLDIAECPQTRFFSVNAVVDPDYECGQWHPDPESPNEHALMLARVNAPV